QKIQQRINRGVNVPAWFEHLGWAYITKATASFDNSYYVFAQQAATCLQEIQPGNFEALLINGFVALNTHDFSQAEQNARSLTQLRDYWADYALLGDALLEKGDLDSAMLAYQTLMDKRPGPQAYARAAELNWRRGQLPSAIEFMQLALTATSPQDKQASAWVITRLAELHLQVLNYPLAAQHAQKALTIDPDYAPALHMSAKTAMALGEWRQAIVFNRRAIAVQPLPHYLWLQIEALRAAGRLDEIGKLEGVLLSAGEADDPRLVAMYLATVGRDGQRALTLAQHELEQRQDALSHDAAAWAYWSVDDAVNALSHIEQALATGLQDARLYYHAGVIYTALDKTRKGTEFLQRAQRTQALLMPSERAHLQRIAVATPSQKNRLATATASTGTI
ncbi:MAG: tetratricopeptide repeat protein, partial [Pseudomonadales bacterium]